MADLGARFRAIPRQIAERIDQAAHPEKRQAAVAIERQIDGLRTRLHAEVERTGARNVGRAWERTVNEVALDLRARNDEADRRVRFNAARADNYSNFGTGIGVRGIDKRISRGRWGYQDVPEFEARFILRGSDMAQRAVNKIVDEMFREGYRVRIADDKDLATEMELSNREARINEGVMTALRWARAFGGCALFLGADDGAKDLSLPLREDRIRSFDYVTPFSPLEMVPVTWYADPLRPKFGLPETYRLTPLDRPPGWSPDMYSMPVIHESRIIAFQGTVNWRGQIVYNVHPGWGDSVFVAIRQVLEDFEQAFGGVSLLMSDFAVSTLKLKRLDELLAAGGAELTVRAQMLEDARSIARVTIIDADEEFKRESTTVTGLPDLIDRFEGRLASAMDLPVDLMLGQAPAGLNATGDSTIRWWYGTVAAHQRMKAQPPLERIVKLRLLAKNGPSKGKLPKNWAITFPSLWRPSEVEAADIRLKQAQADQIYLVNQVVTPQEVARSRFGGEEYSTDTQIDMSLRDDLAGPHHEASKLGLGDEPSNEGRVVAPTAPVAEATSALPKGPGRNEGFPDLLKVATTGAESYIPSGKTQAQEVKPKRDSADRLRRRAATKTEDHPVRKRRR